MYGVGKCRIFFYTLTHKSQVQLHTAILVMSFLKASTDNFGQQFLWRETTVTTANVTTVTKKDIKEENRKKWTWTIGDEIIL